MTRNQRILYTSLIVILIVGLDQAAKEIARQQLSTHPSISLFNDMVRLIYAQNTGAFLSMGADLPPTLRFLVFVVFVALVLAILIYFLLRDVNVSFTFLIAMSLVAGGGIGNLIDRLLYQGKVVDFLLVKLGVLSTGVFNLADMAIMAGVAVVILSNLGLKRQPTQTPQP